MIWSNEIVEFDWINAQGVELSEISDQFHYSDWVFVHGIQPRKH